LGVFELFAVQCCADVHFFCVIRTAIREPANLHIFYVHNCRCGPNNDQARSYKQGILPTLGWKSFLKGGRTDHYIRFSYVGLFLAKNTLLTIFKRSELSENSSSNPSPPKQHEGSEKLDDHDLPSPLSTSSRRPRRLLYMGKC
jgi:hypothetical protein